MTTVTEDEAKTRWCPFARIMQIGNRGPSGDPVAFCIASACMAWRWVLPDRTRLTSPSAYPAPEGEGWTLDSDNGSTKFWSRSNAGPDRSGYCGIAGEPRA